MSVCALQKYLDANGTEGLSRELSINVAEHPSLPLVALKYSQLNSPKAHPIVRECRGIVLEKGTWDVVAKPFRRFFNAQEDPEAFARFGWGDCSATTKHDGSLIIVYWYAGEWHVNTSGSFGLGKCGHSSKSWRQVFWEVSGIKSWQLDGNWTYLFELCTPFNRVVRVYPEPCVYLLSMIRRDTLREMPDADIGLFADALGVKRAETHQFNCVADVEAFLRDMETRDKTFEGVVLRDGSDERFKVKSATYIALHHLFDNGNICNPKRIVPLVLAGDCAEVLSYFPHAKPQFDKVSERLDAEYAKLEATWLLCRELEDQKEFAQAVLPRTQFSSILFGLRKRGGDLASAWRESADLICKRLYAKETQAVEAENQAA